jgi:hypothetical protein
MEMIKLWFCSGRNRVVRCKAGIHAGRQQEIGQPFRWCTLHTCEFLGIGALCANTVSSLRCSLPSEHFAEVPFQLCMHFPFPKLNSCRLGSCILHPEETTGKISVHTIFTDKARCTSEVAGSIEKIANVLCNFFSTGFYSPYRTLAFLDGLLDPQTFGRTPWLGDQSNTRPLPKHRTTQHRNTQTHIHAPSKILTCDLNV